MDFIIGLDDTYTHKQTYTNIHMVYSFKIISYFLNGTKALEVRDDLVESRTI